jgi:hypothetical protein
VVAAVATLPAVLFLKKIDKTVQPRVVQGDRNLPKGSMPSKDDQVVERAAILLP